MSRPKAYLHGQFSWIDLLSPDAASAGDFYTQLFGWSRFENPSDSGVYTMFQQEDLAIGGMGEMDSAMKASGMPAVWNSYVSVDDADALVDRAIDLGGQVELPVMQIMEAGRMAILSDPEGARLSIWEAGEHIGAGLVNEPNSLAWNDLGTRDAGAAKAFYGELFGWTFVDAGNGYHEIMVGERANGGIRQMGPDEGDMPACWLPYISVADCDASVALCESLGGRSLMQPVDIEPGRFCVVCDPQGAVLTLMHINEPE